MKNSFICSLSNFTLITATGEKAAEFLQGQVTCDVREVTETQTRFGAHCSPKGRVLSSFRILKFKNTFYLLTPANMAEHVITQLKKYAVFSKVSLPSENALKILGCGGEETLPILIEIFGDTPSEIDQAVYIENALLIRVRGEIPRFEIIGNEVFIKTLQEKLSNYLQENTDDWHLLDIQSGIAHIYPETRELFTPHMLNYPALNAVSFKKGCYTGQEIIARTQYLGKSKRHLEKLNIDSKKLLNPGDAIYGDKEEIIGTVVDAAWCGENKCEVLAVVTEQK